jgi:hypothetical protein
MRLSRLSVATHDDGGDRRRRGPRCRYGYPATSACDGDFGTKGPAELQPMDRRLRELRARRQGYNATLHEYRFFLSAQTGPLPAAMTIRL